MAVGKEALGAPSRPHGPSRIRKSVGSRVLRVGLALGTIGVGGYEAHQNIPAVQRAVEGLQDEIAPWWNSSFGWTSIFTNKDTSPTPSVESSLTRITPQNTIGLPIAEISVKPDVENKALAIPIPFVVKKDMNIGYERVETRLGFSDKTSGVKDTIRLTNIPKDLVTSAPLSGEFSFSKTVWSTGQARTIASIRFLETPGRFRSLFFDLGDSAPSLPGVSEVKGQGSFGPPFTTYELKVDVKAGSPLFVNNSGYLNIDVSPGVGDVTTGGAVYENGSPVSSFYDLSILTKDGEGIYLASQ